jgi:hypothetical protein
MKRLFIFFAIALGTFCFLKTNTVSAQITNKISLDQGGTLLRVKNTALENVVGSPYLLQNWTKGNVKFADANPINNVLVTRGKNDLENVFSSKVVEFTLDDSGKQRLFRTGFVKSNNQAIPSYLEVLYDGKTKLLVREVKTVIESTGYNITIVTKNINSSLEYYISKANGPVNLIKLNDKSILTVLDKPELAKYIKDNKLNLKEIGDVLRLLQYYDTL